MTQRLKRAREWPCMLNAHIVESQKKYKAGGLKWGEFDCCTFAFDWVAKITELDPMADYRGSYSDREGAIRALWVAGDKTILGALTRVFGAPIPPAHGQRGDIVFRQGESALGIMHCQGTRQIGIFLGEGALDIVDLKNIDHAFRV